RTPHSLSPLLKQPPIPLPRLHRIIRSYIRPDMSYRLIHIIGHQHERHISFGYRSLLGHVLYRLKHLLVILLSKQHDGKARDGFRLHQRECLEKLIHRSKSSGHDDERIGILDENCLANEEMFKRETLVSILISLLLKRQPDITTNGHPSTLKCPAIRGLHYSRSSARHRRESQLCDSPAKFSRLLVIDMIFRKSRGAKHSNAWSNEVQRTECPDEFDQNLPRKLQLISPALRTIEVYGLFRWNYRSFLWFCLYFHTKV